MGLDGTVGTSGTKRDRLPVTLAEPILQRVADEIERKNGRHQRQAGIGRQMGRNQEKLPAVVEHGTPGGRGRLDAEAEKAQTAFGDDRRR